MPLDLFGDHEPELPHPPVSVAVFVVVEHALREAWALVRRCAAPGFDPLAAEENAITHELYKALADRVFGRGIVAGFDRQLFDLPARDAKVCNFDESRRDLMPDLLVRLVRPDIARVRLPTQDGIFIECKPIDETHEIGRHYCDHGLARFTRGDYAWAMTSALMVGYAKAGYDVEPGLGQALRKRPDLGVFDEPVSCPHGVGASTGELVYVTRHRRAFTYLQTGAPALAITIRHIWLRRRAT